MFIRYDEENVDYFYEELDYFHEEDSDYNECTLDSSVVGIKERWIEDIWGWKKKQCEKEDSNLKTDNKDKLNEKVDFYISQSKQYTRDPKLSLKLKKLYNFTCQICNCQLNLGQGEFGCETHHIYQRGDEGIGPDEQNNMLVLCCNCHLLFDKRAITICLKKKKVYHVDKEDFLHEKDIVLRHKIKQEYIDFHNNRMSQKG